MTTFLEEMNRQGLINQLDGDDGRFEKMKATVDAIAAELEAKPALLIRAVLVGLDYNIIETDPLIALAEKALLSKWKTARTLYVCPPLDIYRYLLLGACDKVAKGVKASILWNTAVDTFSLLKVDTKEEDLIRRVLTKWAKEAEIFAQSTPRSKREDNLSVTQKNNGAPVNEGKDADNESDIDLYKVNEGFLAKEIGYAVAPEYEELERSERPGTEGHNPYWHNESPTDWTRFFSAMMAETLATRFNGMSDHLASQQLKLLFRIENVEKSLEFFDQHDRQEQTSKMMVNVLWWGEALYSSSHQLSYRDLKPETAAISMPLDLLASVHHQPVSASVSYVIAESVAKLPSMGFNNKFDLATILDNLGAQRNALPEALIQSLTAPPTKGRWSIRDLLINVLITPNIDITASIDRAGMKPSTKISFPRLAQAFFRQQCADLQATELMP